LDIREDYLPENEMECLGYMITQLRLLKYVLERAFADTEDPGRLREDCQQKAQEYADKGTTFAVVAPPNVREPQTDEARLHFAGGVEKAKRQFLELIEGLID